MSYITQKWVDLLSSFANDYSAKLSETQLAKKSKIPQQTASRYLDMLAKLNLVQHTKQGRNKLFYFDLEMPSTKTIMTLIESQKSLQFQLKTKEIMPAIKEILKNCETLIVFGSYSTGTFNKESDLDIIILGEHNKKEIQKIKQKQTIEINEHYATYKEFAQSLTSKNPLAIEIMQNHTLLGDVSKIITILWQNAHAKR